MIEFRENKGAEHSTHQIFINGVSKDGAIIYGSHDTHTGEYLFHVHLRDKNLARQFLAYSLSEIPPFQYLVSNIVTNDLKLIDYFTIYRESDKDTGNLVYILTFHSQPNLAKWPYSFSFAAYCELMERAIIEQFPDASFQATNNNFSEFEYLTSFQVSLNLSSMRSPLANEIEAYSIILQRLDYEVTSVLLAQQRNNSVVEIFNFPEAVSVPCEQYLLYFVDFLKGLGVEATADLQHEAGQVLFAVTPTDKTEALDKIHTALRMYLQLAASPINDAHDPEDEIAIQRLLANVDHLKSQLRLSYMMVRTQEATIQAQQVTIENQQRILSGKVLLDSLKTDTPKPEDKEEVIDGILALGKYEDKGVIVNFGEVYRRLKQLFKKEE